MPSKITRFASMMRAASSGPGAPSMPKNFFWNDPRWSKARMNSVPLYPSVMIVSSRPSPA